MATNMATRKTENPKGGQDGRPLYPLSPPPSRQCHWRADGRDQRRTFLVPPWSTIDSCSRWATSKGCIRSDACWPGAPWPCYIVRASRKKHLHCKATGPTTGPMVATNLATWKQLSEHAPAQKAWQTGKLIFLLSVSRPALAAQGRIGV